MEQKSDILANSIDGSESKRGLMIASAVVSGVVVLMVFLLHFAFRNSAF